MSETNKAILEAANAAISQGDFEGFLAHCTDDTRWNFLGDRILTGKEAVLQWMKETYLEPPKNDVKNLIADQDFVVAVGEVTVTDKDGKATRSAYCDVWRIRDGRLADLRAYVVPVED